MEIVIDWGIVTLLTVPLGYLANLALGWVAGKLGKEYGTIAKKVVVYAGAIGLAFYFAFEQGASLPPIGDDPGGFILALAMLATLAFKVAQEIYDRLWQKLPVVGAKSRGLGAG